MRIDKRLTSLSVDDLDHLQRAILAEIQRRKELADQSAIEDAESAADDADVNRGGHAAPNPQRTSAAPHVRRRRTA
jgi:hypothetical protein